MSKIHKGFTTAELIIVVSVISILAVVTVVAYRGIQERAITSSLSQELKKVANKIRVDKELDGQYPADLNTINDGSPFSFPPGITYAYNVSGGSFCLQMTKSNISMKINESNTPQTGVCGESFNSMPSDIYVAGDVTIDSSLGKNAPSLRSDGNGSWWYGQAGSRWDTSGDFTYDADFIINPDGSGTRDILNFAFWANGSISTGSPNAFGVRVQVGASDGQFMVITNGSHTLVGPSLPAVSANVWYHMSITMNGTTATAKVTSVDTGAVHGTISYDFSPNIDANHLKSGVVGQHKDGAGTASGSRIDNVEVTP